MALPSKTFMFNYTAKEYNAATHTFPKTVGQLFDEDLVLNTSPESYTDEYVYFGNSGAHMNVNFGSVASNPFNRDAQNSTFTFICKTSGFTSDMENIFANRCNSYNYMVRGNIFHTSVPYFLELSPDTDPQICVIRIYSNGLSERMFLDGEGNILQSTSSSTISWGSITEGASFFEGSSCEQLEEYFRETFYWMYCSLETLTDEEILQVIQYNEGGRFGPDSRGATVQATGGTTTATVFSETGWTASTVSPWISVSPSSGTSGETLVTFTVARNNFNRRIGVVVFTSDNGDTAEYTITQGGEDGLVPLNKIYRNERRIN